MTQATDVAKELLEWAQDHRRCSHGSREQIILLDAVIEINRLRAALAPLLVESGEGAGRA